MPRKGLTLLIAAGLILSTRLGWSATSGAAASTTIDVPVGASAAAPTASTAAPAAVSAPAAVTGVTATAYPSTTAAPAAATATAQSTAAPAAVTAAAAPAPAAEPAATAAPAPAPAPAAEPAATAAAPAPSPAGGIQVPVHGMNMANVEHVFGTPLEKQEAVGKPPITRWVYADYVVYFEYNIVLHTVMKAAPFQAPGAG